MPRQQDSRGVLQLLKRKGDLGVLRCRRGVRSRRGNERLFNSGWLVKDRSDGEETSSENAFSARRFAASDGSSIPDESK